MSKPANTTPASTAINAEAWRRLKYSTSDIGDFLSEMGKFASGLRFTTGLDENEITDKIDVEFFHRIDCMYDDHLHYAVGEMETKLSEVIDSANDEVSSFAAMTENSRGIYIIVRDAASVLEYHFQPDTYTEDQVSAMQKAVDEISELAGLDYQPQPAFGDIQQQLDLLTIRAAA